MFEKFDFSESQIARYYKSALRDLKIARNATENDIKIIGQEMRAKRNWDLYGGGILISKKETGEYLKWTNDIFRKADGYLHKHGRLL